jgi:hypothetical protein
VTVGNVNPQHIALNGGDKAVDARIQDDFVIDSNGTLQLLALFQATTLWTKQQKIHSSENRAEKYQGKQWIAIAICLFSREQVLNHGW